MRLRLASVGAVAVVLLAGGVLPAVAAPVVPAPTVSVVKPLSGVVLKHPQLHVVVKAVASRPKQAPIVSVTADIDGDGPLPLVKGAGNRWTFDSRQPDFEAPVTRQMHFVATDAAGRSTTIPFSFVVPEHHVGVTWVLPTKDDPYVVTGPFTLKLKLKADPYNGYLPTSLYVTYTDAGFVMYAKDNWTYQLDPAGMLFPGGEYHLTPHDDFGDVRTEKLIRYEP